MLNKTGFLRFLVVSLAVVGLCWVAVAQAPAAPAAPGTAAPGAAVSAQNSATAWELQAKTVARQLKLTDEKTAKLVEAYKAARTSHSAAVQAKVGEGGPRGRETYEAMREIATAERAKLEAAIKEFLTPEETKKAMDTLGTFNRRFDQMVIVLDGMKLEKATLEKAMDALTAYVAETGAIMAGASPDADREAFRAKMQQAHEKLDAEMAKILSAEQLAKWREASSRRRGR